LPISSRNSVPPQAISKQPTRSVLASVKAPRTWPNSSLSKSAGDSPPTSTAVNGFPARDDRSWMRRAITSLPVPCSPVTSTFTSDGATRATTERISCTAGSWATMVGSCIPRSRDAPVSSRRDLRSVAPYSASLRSSVTRRMPSHGFCT
jgi:hypothetical protein